MAKSDKVQGTCSVCLRAMQMQGVHPIRHGFSAVGVRHGQHGGFHTGPCGGTGFPHLGISAEGTAWALGRAREQLGATEQRLHELEGNPDLIWYPRKPGSYNQVPGGLPDMSRPVTLRHNEEARYAGDGRPTYANEHRRRLAEQVNNKNSLESTIDAYAKVLATWSPEKYPTTAAAPKIETLHMATPRKNSRGEFWTGVLCRGTRKGSASDRLPKTDDPSKITCKRCRAALGLPPL